LTYYVQLGIDETEDQSRIEQWKRQNCGKDESDFSKNTEAELLQKTVSKQATINYNNCLHSQGLFCTFSSPSPALILLHMDWTPYPGAKTFATIKSSKVVYAQSLEPHAPKGQIFPPNQRIYIGGATALLMRADKDKRATVTASINTDYGPCPEPLVVSGEPVVTAKITIGGSVEKLADVTNDIPIKLEHSTTVRSRIGVPVTCPNSVQSKQLCLRGVDPHLDKYSVGTQTSTCGEVMHTATIIGGCVNLNFTIPGCTGNAENVEPPYAILVASRMAACSYAYSASVKLIGYAWSRIPIKESTSDVTSAGGTIRATYDKSLLDPLARCRGVEYKYKAVVTFPGSDGRLKIVELSNESPIQTFDNVTVRSALLPLEGTVLINLEKTNLEARPATKAQ
jgi:hypothetical protein